MLVAALQGERKLTMGSESYTESHAVVEVLGCSGKKDVFGYSVDGQGNLLDVTCRACATIGTRMTPLAALGRREQWRDWTKITTFIRSLEIQVTAFAVNMESALMLRVKSR